jgi:hypothetical protein
MAPSTSNPRLNREPRRGGARLGDVSPGPEADPPAGARKLARSRCSRVRQPGAIKGRIVVRSLLRLSDRAVEIRRGSAAGESPDEV